MLHVFCIPLVLSDCPPRHILGICESEIISVGCPQFEMELILTSAVTLLNHCPISGAADGVGVQSAKVAENGKATLGQIVYSSYRCCLKTLSYPTPEA
jgi:hypothetical protein